ncbi:unnamed protein product, partial [Didymodactylos carnosus]
MLVEYIAERTVGLTDKFMYSIISEKIPFTATRRPTTIFADTENFFHSITWCHTPFDAKFNAEYRNENTYFLKVYCSRENHNIPAGLCPTIDN